VFANIDQPDERIAIRRDANNNPEWLYINVFIPMTTERAEWYETVPVQAGAFLLVIVLLLSYPLGWGVSRLFRQHRAIAHTQPSSLWLLLATVVLGGVVLGAWLYGSAVWLVGTIESVVLPMWVVGGAWLVVVGTVAVSIAAVLRWLRGAGTLIGRLHYSAVVVGLMLLVWLFRYWAVL
jgi:hypothetical protein